MPSLRIFPMLLIVCLSVSAVEILEHVVAPMALAAASDIGVFIAGRSDASLPLGASDYLPVTQSSITKRIAGSLIAQLTQVNAFTAALTVDEVHGKSYAPTLTSNNYTAVSSDCGKILLLPTGTTPTITLPNINPASGGCVISAIQTTSAQYTPQAASGGTLTANVNSFTKSKGIGAGVSFILTTPSASAAVWAWTGDGA